MLPGVNISLEPWHLKFSLIVVITFYLSLVLGGVRFCEMTAGICHRYVCKEPCYMKLNKPGRWEEFHTPR